MQTIVALYNDLHTAMEAINEVAEIGFARENVSLIVNDIDKKYAKYVDDNRKDEHFTEGEGAGVGALAGGLTGLVVGLAALAIPGIGPVVGAGPLVAGLAGATTGVVAGGLTGGIVGALIQAGIPETEAHVYAEAIRRGGTLVSINSPDDWADRVEDILNRHHPVNIVTKATEWQQEGWKRFDENAKPYSSDELERKQSLERTQPMQSGTRVRHARRYGDRSARV